MGTLLIKLMDLDKTLSPDECSCRTIAAIRIIKAPDQFPQ